jgi:hypothetical protein
MSSDLFPKPPRSPVVGGSQALLARSLRLQEGQ